MRLAVFMVLLESVKVNWLNIIHSSLAVTKGCLVTSALYRGIPTCQMRHRLVKAWGSFMLLNILVKRPWHLIISFRWGRNIQLLLMLLILILLILLILHSEFGRHALIKTLWWEVGHLMIDILKMFSALLSIVIDLYVRCWIPDLEEVSLGINMFNENAGIFDMLRWGYSYWCFLKWGKGFLRWESRITRDWLLKATEQVQTCDLELRG